MSYKVSSESELVTMTKDLVPFPRLKVTDSEGAALGTGYQAKLDLVPQHNGTATNITKDGALDGDVWEFPWVEPETDAPIIYKGIIRLIGTAAIPSLFAPTYTVYDPAELWADPGAVLALAGGDYTQAQAVQAILLAQSIVGAWVSVPVLSPVPDPIRQATTILAARALTTISGGLPVGSTGQIVSETIADYTVRYASPEDGGGSGYGILPADVAAILAPYHSRVGMTKIGPASPYTPLPVIPAALDSDLWWGDAVIYDEDYP